jgi:hypothetical protein
MLPKWRVQTIFWHTRITLFAIPMPILCTSQLTEGGASMGNIGEPILKPVVIAVALIYVTLISQPLWAKQPDSTGQVAPPDHATTVGALTAQSLSSSD